MSVFLLISGLLVALVLFHVLRPLLRGRTREGVSHDQANVTVYRDQLRELETDLRAGTIAGEQYQRARQEIEKRLLEDVAPPAGAARAGASPEPRRSPVSAVVVGLAIPFAALALYLGVGTPAAIVPGAVQQQQQQAGSHELTPEQITGMIERLAVRLKENPDNAEGWTMLGRTYNAVGRYAEASNAFAEAAKRNPADAQLLADYADALGMAQGRTLAGEPEKLIARALKADPTNIKALALAGTAAFDKKDYAGASKHWERILEVAPPGSQLAESIRPSIDEARSLAGKGPLPDKAQAKAQAQQPAQTATAPGGGARVSGVARLAPALAGKIAPDDTVFIFARAAEGSRMPLAILRKQARDLPVSFVLDDSMAMSPQMKLSSAPSIVVGALVSKSANAMPKAGDLQGQSAPVKVGAERLEVLIDSEVR
jgi:cytochrome c-type biogenesis protein CcmH